jgi:hypothetical protein
MLASSFEITAVLVKYEPILPELQVKQPVLLSNLRQALNSPSHPISSPHISSSPPKMNRANRGYVPPITSDFLGPLCETIGPRRIHIHICSEIYGASAPLAGMDG